MHRFLTTQNSTKNYVCTWIFRLIRFFIGQLIFCSGGLIMVHNSFSFVIILFRKWGRAARTAIIIFSDRLYHHPDDLLLGLYWNGRKNNWILKRLLKICKKEFCHLCGNLLNLPYYLYLIFFSSCSRISSLTLSELVTHFSYTIIL